MNRHPNIIFKRKSVRKFSGKAIDTALIERVLAAGMQAPSAHNSQCWEFLVVRDQKDKEAIAEMSPYASPAKGAAVAILVLGNKLLASKTERWMPQDLGACTENILLQLVEEGLSGVWLGFYPDEDRVRQAKEYFSLPEYIVPFAVIACGYAAEESVAQDRFQPQKIHYDHY